MSELEYLDAQWGIYVSSRFPDATRPEIEPVRRVTRTEFPEVVAECLRDAGFDAGTDPDGSFWFSSAPEQAESLAIAIYACIATYPLAPEYYQPFGEAQVGEHYDYLVNVAVPCLASLGYTSTAPPSREEYIETYNTSSMWDLYAPIAGAVANIDEWYDVVVQCPEFPN